MHDHFLMVPKYAQKCAHTSGTPAVIVDEFSADDDYPDDVSFFEFFERQ
jgi:hypothetical protein